MGYNAQTLTGQELAAWLAWNHPQAEVDDRAIGEVTRNLLDRNATISDVPAGTLWQMYQIAVAAFRLSDRKQQDGRGHLRVVK